MLSQYLIPHHLFSRLMAIPANIKQTQFKNWGIKHFIKKYNVNMAEALESDPTAYPDFNHFFIRKLKPELRPINTEANVIISPVDGVVSQLGPISDGRIIQAKGREYSVAELLVDDKQSKEFANGQFITLYLAPKDYHRIHMPISGTLEKMIYVPGKLFSVQPRTVDSIPNLFARNERVIALFNTEFGRMAVVLVAAMIVAGVHTAWHGPVMPSSKKEIQHWQYPVADINTVHLAKGDEVGYFQLGSTVILLFADPNITWENHLKEMTEVKMGQALARKENAKK